MVGESIGDPHRSRAAHRVEATGNNDRWQFSSGTRRSIFAGDLRLGSRSPENCSWQDAYGTDRSTSPYLLGLAAENVGRSGGVYRPVSKTRAVWFAYTIRIGRPRRRSGCGATNSSSETMTFHRPRYVRLVASSLAAPRSAEKIRLRSSLRRIGPYNADGYTIRFGPGTGRRRRATRYATWRAVRGRRAIFREPISDAAVE